MSRNLYKLVKDLEKRVARLEQSNKLLQNNVDHLETLLRIKDKIPERPFYPTQPATPWYRSNEPTLSPPYKITCESDLENDPFVKLMKETFGL